MREIEAGQARVFVDHGFQWDGSNNVWLTRARACYVLQAGPAFDIRPRGIFSRVTGFQAGVSSGDPCFDDFFTVRTASPEDTYDALTTRARSLLAGQFEDARLVSDGHMVTLWREGDFGREMDATAAAEVVAEIVHFRADHLRDLARLPNAEMRDAAGPWDERNPPGVVLRVPTPVVVEPHAGERGPVTSVRAACGRALEAFHVLVDDSGRVRGHANRVPDCVAEQAPGIGSASILCDGSQIRLAWTRLVKSRAVLLAGARLIAAIAASQSHGVYR